MNTETKLIKTKLELLQLAEKLGNISQACRLFGYSRDSFCRIKKLYDSLAQLQKDLDEWLEFYNKERTHSGRYGYGKTPMQTFIDSKSLALAKQLNSVPSEDNYQSVSLELL